MFWWIVLATFVALITSYVLNATPVGSLLAILPAYLVKLIFGIGLGQESQESKGVLVTFMHLFQSLISCFAGLLLGSLVLRGRYPIGFYWLLCGAIALVTVIKLKAVGELPDQNIPLLMEAWPNLIGPILAIVFCYQLVRPWFV